MIAATAGTRCAPLVCVPKRDVAWVKPALGRGHLLPAGPHRRGGGGRRRPAARYPPAAWQARWGPFLAHARWGVGLFDHLPCRGEDSVCVLLIETRAAIENIEARSARSRTWTAC